MRVDTQAQIVADPLAHARGQILLSIGANGIEHRNGEYCCAGELQHRHFVGAHHAMNQAHRPAVGFARAEYVIQHYFQRPRLQQVSNTLAGNGDEPEGERTPMRLQERTDTEPPRVPFRCRCVFGCLFHGCLRFDGWSYLGVATDGSRSAIVDYKKGQRMSLPFKRIECEPILSTRDVHAGFAASRTHSTRCRTASLCRN